MKHLLSHFEVNISWWLRVTAPLCVCRQDALLNKRANALAIDAVRFFVIRAVEACVPEETPSCAFDGAKCNNLMENEAKCNNLIENERAVGLTTWDRRKVCSRRKHRAAWLLRAQSPPERQRGDDRRI